MLKGQQFRARSMVSSLFKIVKNNYYGDVTHQQTGQTYLAQVHECSLIHGLGLGAGICEDVKSNKVIDQTNFMSGHSNINCQEEV